MSQKNNFFSTETYQSFLQREALPESYTIVAKSKFEPLCHSIFKEYSKLKLPLIVGINGCQGSGKSTLATFLTLYLSEIYGLNTANLSLDDFYLTKAERLKKAEEVHPLFATRGVPGTHDMQLLMDSLHHLVQQKGTGLLPSFDKSQDDRIPKQQWQEIETPVDILILEGWCLGATDQPLSTLFEAKNQLELSFDTHATWRQHINYSLAKDFPNLNQAIDFWVMLKAPSFDNVFQWRLEQEQKLAQTHATNDDASCIMSTSEVRHFIDHFQRVTEDCLEQLPDKVHVLFELDSNRNIIAERQPTSISTDES